MKSAGICTQGLYQPGLHLEFSTHGKDPSPRTSDLKAGPREDAASYPGTCSGTGGDRAGLRAKANSLLLLDLREGLCKQNRVLCNLPQPPTKPISSFSGSVSEGITGRFILLVI